MTGEFAVTGTEDVLMQFPDASRVHSCGFKYEHGSSGPRASTFCTTTIESIAREKAMAKKNNRNFISVKHFCGQILKRIELALLCHLVGASWKFQRLVLLVCQLYVL